MHSSRVDSETSVDRNGPGVPQESSRRPLRWVINLWLGFHLMAIIVAPASVSPSSRLIQSTWTFFQPYLQILYLNNGYHYFAPEPGESTLLSYTIKKADGTTIQGRVPDKSIQPRLLYHRHFMLTERMNPFPPDLQRAGYTSYARHLARKYDATEVTLTKLIHYMPTMQMSREGVPLDAPDSFVEQPLGVFRGGEFREFPSSPLSSNRAEPR